MCNFRVGQKVVCVGGSSPRKAKSVSRDEAVSNGANYPEIGKVYTIRQINVWPDGTTILLEEVSNIHLVGWKGASMEPGFPASGFRPVAKRKTDITVFTRLLNTTPETVGV